MPKEWGILEISICPRSKEAYFGKTPLLGSYLIKHQQKILTKKIHYTQQIYIGYNEKMGEKKKKMLIFQNNPSFAEHTFCCITCPPIPYPKVSFVTKQSSK